MMKKFINDISNAIKTAIIFLIASAGYMSAQINVGGEPMSSMLMMESNFNSVTLPELDVAQAIREDAVTKQLPEMPMRYGLVVPVDFTLENSGTWETLSDGSRIWRLGIKSTDAKSLNLFFENFYMPKGSFTFVYDLNKTRVIGAFTEINNSVSGEFATAIVPGSFTVIEYYEPVYARGTGRLHISKVIHAYIDITGNNPFVELPCQINVNCPIGAPWVAQKRSIARMTFTEGGSGYLCSGGLLNNSLNNRVPYFLTAQHCTSDNWNSLVADFNYESPTCVGALSGPSQSMSGAVSRAENYATDFRLLQFNNSVPASINAFFGGWDRTGNTPENGTGIHHPGGVIKKISVDTDPLVTSSGFGGRLTNGFWRVAWNYGMIEGGSSGSPVFDQNKRAVGQLLGGNIPQCENPQFIYEHYGKISESWAYGGSPSNQLKDWLDPNNSGITTLDGINDLTGVAPISNFTSDLQNLPIGGSSVNFFDLSAYEPSSWSWSFPGATPSTSTERNPSGISYTATGAYTVSLTATNAFGSNLKTIVNYIRVAGVPITPISLKSPSSGTTVLVSQNDPSLYSFRWTSSTVDPTVKYLFRIKRVGLYPEFVYQANNNGLDSGISLRRSFLDSLAVTMGLTGDSVRCTWRASVINGLDTLSTTNNTVNIRRTSVGISQISSSIPELFALYNNYPNPFNPKTIIKFDISKNAFVKLKIFNMLGEELSTLVSQDLNAGSYSVDFDGAGLSSGIYFYRIEAQDFSQTKRMVLTK